MTAYVGIDQSYTGLAIVAVSTDPGDPVFESLHNFETAKHGTGVNRLLSIYQHIMEVLREIDDIAHICMEGYSPGSKFGREKAGELGAIIKLAIYDHFDLFADEHGDLRYPTIVQPSAVKKFVTDNGQAKKNLMLVAVYKKWGYETSDDNLADAYSLARMAQAVETQTTNYAYEKAVLAKITPHTEMIHN